MIPEKHGDGSVHQHLLELEVKARFKVGEKLEKVDVSFVHNASPQKILVQVMNRGELVHIQSIKISAN